MEKGKLSAGWKAAVNVLDMEAQRLREGAEDGASTTPEWHAQCRDLRMATSFIDAAGHLRDKADALGIDLL